MRLIYLLGGLILATALVFSFTNQRTQTPQLASQPLGGDFTLSSQTSTFRLSELEPQRLALIYFGYTWCPDICPTALHLLANTLQELPPEQAQHLQPLFISVDPQRDTPERLAAYVDFFDTNFIGLTGTPEYIANLAKNYGVIYRYISIDSAMGYTVDHSSNLYLVNAQGQILASWPSNLHSFELLQALQPYLDSLTKQHTTN